MADMTKDLFLTENFLWLIRDLVNNKYNHCMKSIKIKTDNKPNIVILFFSFILAKAESNHPA